MNVILIIFKVFLWVFGIVPPIVLLLVVIREYFPRFAFWKFAKMESDLATDICSKPKCRSRLFKAYIRMINRKIRMVARYGETKVEISFQLQREIELPLTEREQALLRIHYMKKGFDVAHYSSNLDSGIILHWPKFPQLNNVMFLPSLKYHQRSDYIHVPMEAYRLERIIADAHSRAYSELAKEYVQAPDKKTVKGKDLQIGDLVDIGERPYKVDIMEDGDGDRKTIWLTAWDKDDEPYCITRHKGEVFERHAGIAHVEKPKPKEGN